MVLFCKISSKFIFAVLLAHSVHFPPSIHRAHADPPSKLDAMYIHAEGNHVSDNGNQHIGDINNYCRLPTLLQPLTRKAGMAGYT